MFALMPVLPEDVALRTSIRGLGLEPGEGLADPLPEEVIAGLGAGMADLVDRMQRVSTSAEIFGSREFFAGGEKANAQMDRLRAWLVARNRIIMGVLCLGLGALLLVKGAMALL